LDGEVEGDTGNPIRVIRRGHGGRNGDTMAGGGSGSTARLCGTGEAGEREKEGGRASSPPHGAPGAVVRRWAAAEWRRGDGPRRRWRGSFGLGFARAGGGGYGLELGHGWRRLK
jgi:hypothetical protein